MRNMLDLIEKYFADSYKSVTFAVANAGEWLRSSTV